DAGAAQQDKPGKKDDAKKDEPPKLQPRTSDTPPAKAEPQKLYSFEMRNKPWNQVMEWLVDATGLAFVGPSMPQGTFNFIEPGKKQHTIPEIIDIINEGLQSNSEKQKYILLRRERTFTLVPADETIDPGLLPRVNVDELDKRGTTEYVQMVL